jgi:AcrR family transcriptional regulator
MPDSDPKRRGDRRERTRLALLDAASALIGAQGYDAFSLEAVAAKAGVTRRTIYDHFKDKHDLIIAVISRRRAPIFPGAEPGASFRDYMKTFGSAVAAAVKAQPEHGVRAASFEIYALKHADMRRQTLARNRIIYARWAENFENTFSAAELPMPPARLARVLHAMVDGLMARHFLMPEEFDEEVIVAAFLALARPNPAGPKKIRRPRKT